MGGAERALRDANIRGEKLVGWQEPDAGVCCQTNAAGENHITQLAFALNNLNGELPPTMADFTELDNLSACGNNITGVLPEFSDKMLFLRMYTNAMSGTIPASVSKMTNMKFMSLGDNDFTGPTPDLTALTAMTDLYLDCNHLSGIVNGNNTWSYSGKCFLDSSTLLEKCSKPTDNTFSCPLPPNAKKNCHATCK